LRKIPLEDPRISGGLRHGVTSIYKGKPCGVGNSDSRQAKGIEDNHKAPVRIGQRLRLLHVFLSGVLFATASTNTSARCNAISPVRG
jgi:hypothetical protein